MNGCFALVALVVMLGCSAGDDTVEGGRAKCAFGGALTDCPDAERTSGAACWRLVDCGAIPLESEDENRFDWGNCVDGIDRATSDRQRLMINCIATSTCDELRVSGSPSNPNPNEMHCILFGAQ
jgi:hypothetical protein